MDMLEVVRHFKRPDEVFYSRHHDMWFCCSFHVS